VSIPFVQYVLPIATDRRLIQKGLHKSSSDIELLHWGVPVALTHPMATFQSFPLDRARAIVDGIPEDRRIVLLGESTHGTEEFYRTRVEITKRLVEERGFTAVVFEADWPFMEAASEYTRSRRATPFPDGPARFPAWMWRNQCMVEFFDWCRRQPPARVPELFGMDCYSLFESKRAVISFLEKHDPEFAAEVKSRLAHLDRYEVGG
jgi:erythromycin esterase-like protein